MNYIEQIKHNIRSVQDFPQPGIVFKDIQPILENPILFPHTIFSMSKLTKPPDYYIGIESRGFIFATALAKYLKCGIKLIRKKNKLPPPVLSISYQLEYGEDTLEIQPGTGNVVIVDDVYATGGTMNAAVELCQRAGYNVIGKLVFIDLVTLHGSTDVKSLIQYE
jgi:adenine phosphoribosyltransferase